MDTITAVRTRLTTEETVLSSSTDVLTELKSCPFKPQTIHTLMKIEN